MASVNRVTIIGNLGQDPEVRYAASGSAVCNISVATSRNWKDKTTGERQEETEWHRVVFYDRLAEIAGEYLKKGKSVYIEGRLKTRKWTDKEGVDRYTTEIMADQMQLLGGRDDSGAGQSANNSTSRAQAEPRRQSPPAQSTNYGPHANAPKRGPFDDMADDIPF